MSRWRLYREQRQRKRKVFELLMVGGAVRPADVEPRYFGRERRIIQSHKELTIQADIVRGSASSIWTVDLSVLWHEYVKKRGTEGIKRSTSRRAA